MRLALAALLLAGCAHRAPARPPPRLGGLRHIVVPPGPVFDRDERFTCDFRLLTDAGTPDGSLYCLDRDEALVRDQAMEDSR